MQPHRMVNGAAVPMSAEEIAQREAEEAAFVAQNTPSLMERLHAVFELLAPEVQADLSPLKAAVKLELDLNRTRIARLIIERANIPETLEPVRERMLGEFPAE